MHKKLISVLILLLISLNGWCQNFTADGIHYRIMNSSLAVIECENPEGYIGNITIPKTVIYKNYTYTVTKVGSTAFRNCGKLSSVTLPDTIREIEPRAFEACGISQITLPSKLKVLGKYAFYNCKKLKEIEIPQAITKIEFGTFRNCAGLESIKLSPKIDTIDYLAFDSCVSLKAIDISALIKYISTDAFLSCQALINVDTDNLIYSSQQGVLYNKQKTKLLFCPTTDSIYQIPNSVVTIGEFAFWGKDNLKTIVIPPSVKTIEDYAFARSGLTSLKLPKSVKSVGLYSFAGCMVLKGLDIDSTIYQIHKISIDNDPEPFEYYPECWVCKEPTFPMEKWRYFGDNTLLPTSRNNIHVSGKVTVYFKVDVYGFVVSMIRIAKSNNPIFELEAVRLIHNTPPWIPGEIDQKTAELYTTYLIVFNYKTKHKYNTFLNSTQ